MQKPITNPKFVWHNTRFESPYNTLQKRASPLKIKTEKPQHYQTKCSSILEVLNKIGRLDKSNEVKTLSTESSPSPFMSQNTSYRGLDSPARDQKKKSLLEGGKTIVHADSKQVIDSGYLTKINFFDNEAKDMILCTPSKSPCESPTPDEFKPQMVMMGQVQDSTRRKVRVNTAFCRFEIDTIQAVINDEEYRESKDDGNLYWFGLALRDQDCEMLKTKQCLANRYPKMDHFAKKNNFCVIISRLQRFYPEHFSFLPESFLLPDEAQDLEIYMKKNSSSTFICKPSRGRGGDGIFIVRKFVDIPKTSQEYTVQRYIDNPLLLNSKKFDFRVYVVITGINSIEAYVSEEGIARFCTANYKKPDGLNIKNQYMHLTNYSLNKQNEKFKFSGSDYSDINSSASKQLLTNVFKKLKSKGCDVSQIKQQIEDIALKTIIALEPYLQLAYRNFISPGLNDAKSFQILGLDILVDENKNCWLMEINANPSLNVFNESNNNGEVQQQLSEIDQFVKTKLVKDTIGLLSTAPLFSFKRTLSQNAYKPVSVRNIGFLKQIKGPQSDDDYFEELYIYSKAYRIFQYLQGPKVTDFLTISQFAQMTRLTKLSRAQTDQIFKSAVAKGKTTMDLTVFFQTLEDVSAKANCTKKAVESLTELLDQCIAQI